MLRAVWLANEQGLPQDIFILILENLSKLKFFQYLSTLSSVLQAHNWLPQGANINVVCEKAHFSAIFWDYHENFNVVLDHISSKQNLQQEPAGNNRIFIGRKHGWGLNIINFDEIRAGLAKHEFAYIECNELSVRE